MAVKSIVCVTLPVNDGLSNSANSCQYVFRFVADVMVPRLWSVVNSDVFDAYGVAATVENFVLSTVMIVVAETSTQSPPLTNSAASLLPVLSRTSVCSVLVEPGARDP